MQIELAPEIEATLAEEAGRLGLSSTQLSVKILTDHVARTPLPKPSVSPEEEARDELFEKHIAWLKASSPGWETRDPYAVDWQAIKAEGRKY